jgi:hypothetical protein
VSNGIHVNVGRLRTATNGKRLIWLHRVAARSDRAKELGLRDSVLPRWVELRGAGREPPWPVDKSVVSYFTHDLSKLFKITACQLFVSALCTGWSKCRSPCIFVEQKRILPSRSSPS